LSFVLRHFSFNTFSSRQEGGKQFSVTASTGFTISAWLHVDHLQLDGVITLLSLASPKDPKAGWSLLIRGNGSLSLLSNNKEIEFPNVRCLCCHVFPPNLLYQQFLWFFLIDFVLFDLRFQISGENVVWKLAPRHCCVQQGQVGRHIAPHRACGRTCRANGKNQQCPSFLSGGVGTMDGFQF
jgi:hypothetical protein